MRSGAGLGALALVAACSRSGVAPADASADGPLVSISPDAAPPEAPASAAFARFATAAVAPVEARRVRVTRFAEEPSLPADALEKHFSGGHGAIDVQIAPLSAAGRRAILAVEADKPTSDARPFALVADAERVLWSKERPHAGIMPPVGPLAIAAAPLGRVALAAYDPPTTAVALRLWDDDGAPFADFQAMTVEGCDALSLLYWPKHGYVIAAVRVGATHVQLVTENGSASWGQGLDLGARSRANALAPASLAADSDDTFVLVQIVQLADGDPFHALAFRYDVHGAAVWPAAVDLGALTRAPGARERAWLTSLRPGVRVALPGGDVDVLPTGDVKRVAR